MMDTTDAPEPAASAEDTDAPSRSEQSKSQWNWQEHFTVLARNHGNFKVDCNYCHGEPITGGATRFKKHLLGCGGVRKCSAAPDSVVDQLRSFQAAKDAEVAARRDMQRDLLQQEREAKRARLCDLSSNLSSGSTRVNSKWKQTTMSECAGAAALDIAQQTVARMFYRAAIPFHAVAFPEVIDAFDAVCEYGATTGSSTFALPTAPSLRNSRLDAEVKRIELELAAHKSAVLKFGLSLQTDGKDCMSRRHLVNIITTTPLGPEFREVVDVSGRCRDADSTAQVILDSIKRMPQDDQEALVSIVTDTPNVNKKAWEVLEAALPHVHCVPCAAHCCNLHFKHIARDIPEFGECVEECKLVVRRFANVDFAREMLRKATPVHTGGRQLEVYKPGETRFASNFRMIDRLCTLRYAITAVALGQAYQERCQLKKDPCPVVHLVGTNGFWEKLEMWRDLLFPVYELLREVDTFEAKIHLVYESALGIQEHYKTSPSPFAAKCGEVWEADWEYLHSPIHSCAHVLDPTYQNDNLQDDDDDIVWAEFLLVCEKVLGSDAGALAVQQYSLFQQQQGVFGTAMAKSAAKTMAPHDWWASYGSATPQLRCLAMKVLSQPASASSSEQSWSEYDFVHSKRRNRLKVEVASKLVYVHSNLRLLSKSRNCSRHTELLKLSWGEAHAARSKAEKQALTEGWDGDCSDEEIGTEAQSVATYDTAEPNSVPLDTNSFINADLGIDATNE